VFENVLVGVRFGRRGAATDPNEAAMEILEHARLSDRPNVLAGSLTLLQRKRLELARALATQPRLLLLDEIAGGLIEAEVDELIETIRGLRSNGTTIVWIEHVVHALLSVVDRLLAIDFGRVLADGVPADVIASREVQAVYMGVEDE
jgi:branched-chain amino acid transport system ATP-binding protein